MVIRHSGERRVVTKVFEEPLYKVCKKGRTRYFYCVTVYSKEGRQGIYEARELERVKGVRRSYMSSWGDGRSAPYKPYKGRRLGVEYAQMS